MWKLIIAKSKVKNKGAIAFDEMVPMAGIKKNATARAPVLSKLIDFVSDNGMAAFALFDWGARSNNMKP
jgi:hypothetical protein